MFTNRETATIIWASIVLVWMMKDKSIREAVVRLVKSATHRTMLTAVGFMAVYTVGMVALLNRRGLWDVSLLKDTIMWFAFSGLALGFQFVNAKSDEPIFKQILKDNLKAVIILEFLMSTYTFSLLGELIFIPVMTVIAMLDVVAKQDEKNMGVSKLISGIQTLVGLYILMFVISKAIADMQHLGTLGTLKSIILAPILSIMFSPAVYLILLFSAYVQVFVRLEVGPEKNEGLKRYAKRRILLFGKLNLARVNRLQRTKGFRLVSIRTEEDVDKVMAEVQLEA